MVEKDRVYGLAQRIVAAECERKVADTSAHLRMRKIVSDPADRFDEINGVAVVSLDAGGHGQHIGVENDVGGRNCGLIDEQAVGTLTDFDAPAESVGLSFLVERHHDHSGSVTVYLPGFGEEFFLAFLQGYRVDDGFALDDFERRADSGPV